MNFPKKTASCAIHLLTKPTAIWEAELVFKIEILKKKC